MKPPRDDSDKPSLCFVAPGAYNVLSGRKDLHHIGGAEVQVVSLAHALVELGYPVSFVTWDHGQPDGEDCNGIRVYKCFDPVRGLPIIRFFHPRWTKLIAAMARADADVYLQACADSVTGQAALWCGRHVRRFIYLVMHDWDCRADLPKLKTRRERILYRYGLRKANAVVAQTERQRTRLLDAQAISSIVVYPSGGRSQDDLPLAKYHQGKPRVLWLGRYAPVKRIEWLLDVARQLNPVDFDLVGGANKNDKYTQDILNQAKDISNVYVHGAIPHSDVDQYYRRAHCLVLTSIDEGFPSVYLEAWSWGLPTVTTVDVDGIIARHGLGAVAGSISELVEVLNDLYSSQKKWQECSRRARDYYLGHHTPSSTARSVAKIIQKISPCADNA